MRCFLRDTGYWILVAVFLAGCATTPVKPGMSSFLAAHRLVLGSQPYLPCAALIQAGRGSQSWDPESQVWTLEIGSHQLKASPGIPVALVDGTPQVLPAAPVMRDGELFLPEAVWNRWVNPWIVAPAVPIPSAAPTRLRKIVVDAGHGGHDPGAIGRGGLREKTVTLDVARRLRELLERDGFQVIMTRDSDRFIPLSRRSTLANQAQAHLFVSIHANASRRRSITGFEVYILSEATDDHARALEAAENFSLPGDLEGGASDETEAIVWDLLYTEHRAESVDLASAICRGLKGSRLPVQNRGVKSARFAVLKGSRMPAVLVEVGFLSSPAEEVRLRSSEYRQQLAEGIRGGILAFRNEYD